jgi:hypothetical protein
MQNRILYPTSVLFICYRLNYYGAEIAYDGAYFDACTTKAIRAFQSANGLAATGAFDAATANHLCSSTAASIPANANMCRATPGTSKFGQIVIMSGNRMRLPSALTIQDRCNFYYLRQILLLDQGNKC